MGPFSRYKSTALALVVTALVSIWGVGLVVDPDSAGADQALGVVLLAAAAASVVGLWCLATERLTVGANQALVTTGLLAAGGTAIQAMVEDFAFFVWVFGPMLVLALVALWLGIVGRGLQNELARSGPG